MIELEKHTVRQVPEGTRFLDYCKQNISWLPSGNSIKKAIKQGQLLLNNEPASTGKWVKENDIITLVELQSQPPKGFQLELEVLYEDEYLAIINKPAGIITSGNQLATIANALIHNLEKSDSYYPTPIHRLDKATSGLLVCAKTLQSRIALGSMLAQHEIQKTYHAIVHGKIDGHGIMESPIENKTAITHWETQRVVPSLKNGHLSLLKLQPKTGRTHQIRIHLAEKGFPIVGDTIHGNKALTFSHKGLMLVASGLSFQHPLHLQDIDNQIDIPNKFESLLTREEKRWLKYHG